MILVLSVRVLVGASYMVAVASHRDAGDVGGVHEESIRPVGYRAGSGGGTRQADDGPHHVSS